MTSPHEPVSFTPPHVSYRARAARQSADFTLVGLHHEIKQVLEDRLVGKSSQSEAVAGYEQAVAAAVQELAALTVDLGSEDA